MARGGLEPPTPRFQRCDDRPGPTSSVRTRVHCGRRVAGVERSHREQPAARCVPAALVMIRSYAGPSSLATASALPRVLMRRAKASERKTGDALASWAITRNSWPARCSSPDLANALAARRRPDASGAKSRSFSAASHVSSCLLQFNVRRSRSSATQLVSDNASVSSHARWAPPVAARWVIRSNGRKHSAAYPLMCGRVDVFSLGEQGGVSFGFACDLGVDRRTDKPIGALWILHPASEPLPHVRRCAPASTPLGEPQNGVRQVEGPLSKGRRPSLGKRCHTVGVGRLAHLSTQPRPTFGFVLDESRDRLTLPSGNVLKYEQANLGGGCCSRC